MVDDKTLYLTKLYINKCVKDGTFKRIKIGLWYYKDGRCYIKELNNKSEGWI